MYGFKPRGKRKYKNRQSATKRAFIAGLKAGKRSARSRRSGKKRWY